MIRRWAWLLTLSAVVLVHGALLSLVFLVPAAEPQEIQLPTVQGMLIPAPPAEVVQVPAAREIPPAPKQPEAKPPQPKAVAKPKPKPKQPPKPKPKPPPVAAPPSEQAISVPPEEVVEKEAIEEAQTEEVQQTPPAEASPIAVDQADDALGAPVVPPRVDAQRTSNPSPAYPRRSRRLREEGTVVLKLLILADGTVGEIRVETSSGYPRLDETALAAVKRWRYVPATQGGKPISYEYLQPIVFSLTN